jgi:hypothetical protein
LGVGGAGLVAVVVEDEVGVLVVVELTVEVEGVVGAEGETTLGVVGVGVGVGELLVVCWLVELPLQATARAATSAATTAVAACLARMHVPFTWGWAVRRLRAAAGRGSRGCHGSD